MTTVTHYGHACLFVETTRGARLLFDPGTLSSGFQDLRDLTAVLVSHEHPDHADGDAIRALMAANPDAELLVDEVVVPALDGLTPRVVHAGDHIELNRVVVDVLGGTHEPIVDAFPGTGNSGYLIDDGVFYHPGDAWDVPQVPVDIVALPIGGPWLKFADAIAYLRAVRPRVAVPIHERQLSSTGQADDMIPMFAPEGTTYVALEHGVATRL